MNCKNCDYSYAPAHNFCPNCGQSTKEERISFASLASQLSEGVFQVDKGFLYTLRELFVRPGDSIRAYIDGQRKNHFKPVAYVLTLSTVYFLLSKWAGSGTFLTDLVQGVIDGSLGDDPKVNSLGVIQWFIDNYAYLVVLLLPVFALASWLSFRKTKFNYFEHTVLAAYVTGQQAVFYTIHAFVSLFSKSGIWVIGTLILSVAYTFYVFRQFFGEYTSLNVLIRTLLTYVLYTILAFVALVISISVQLLLT